MIFNTKKFTLTLLIIIVLSFPVFASGTKEAAEEGFRSRMAVIDETETSVTFREADGNIIILPKKPERTIVCHNSLLDLWYMAGGESLARIRGSINVPEEAEDLPLLGTAGTINNELIMELEPDFLIFTDSGIQTETKRLFTKEGITGVTIEYNTYEDFRVILDLFTRLNMTREIYENIVIPTEKEVEEIIEQVPHHVPPPSACILFASTKYIKVETQNTSTGYMCRKLGARNIYIDNRIEGATRVELSLEYIMESNPEIIFVITMGDTEKCRERIERDVVSSDIWGELSAVKNGRFIYLDKSYSLYKPNRFYPEAFRIIADYIYPDSI